MRFTLRDLFWLTLVVALLLGWWLDRGRLAERCEQERARAWRAEWELATWRLRNGEKNVFLSIR